jgi:hypothetical protein
LFFNYIFISGVHLFLRMRGWYQDIAITSYIDGLNAIQHFKSVSGIDLHNSYSSWKNSVAYILYPRITSHSLLFTYFMNFCFIDLMHNEMYVLNAI